MIKCLDLKNFNINYSLSKNFDYQLLKQNLILPIYENELVLSVGICDDSNLKQFSQNLKKPIKTINFLKNDLIFELDYLKEKIDFYLISQKILQSQNSSQLQNLIDKIIQLAVLKNASDIHIETQADHFSIKFRIDGILIQFFRFDIALFSKISSLLKLNANLDITNKRLPQNGRFVIDINQDFDFRLSTMPTINGESIVIRILERNFDKFYLDKLGFEQKNLKLLKEKISLTQGLILVTGPTGSGKTTTLYSIIKELKDTNKKIITIEDPVEYKIDNITQISVNVELDLTYNEILKNILRQDPDILLIGEIRDSQTLKSAIRAAMTGHLVFATLHTNDAISTIHRLIDLESESFLISSVLKCVISQRLVRSICQECKDTKNGCIQCNYTGYKSRIMISEILDINDDLASFITNKATYNELKKCAQNNEFTTMEEDGKQKVINGITTHQELLVAFRS